MGNKPTKPEPEAPPPCAANEEDHGIDAIKLNPQQHELGVVIVVVHETPVWIRQIPITPGMDDDMLFDEMRWAYESWWSTTPSWESSRRYPYGIPFRFASVRVELSEVPVAIRYPIQPTC